MRGVIRYTHFDGEGERAYASTEERERIISELIADLDDVVIDDHPEPEEEPAREDIPASPKEPWWTPSRVLYLQFFGVALIISLLMDAFIFGKFNLAQSVGGAAVLALPSMIVVRLYYMPEKKVTVSTVAWAWLFLMAFLVTVGAMPE